jgi:hypothetical protein
MVNSLSAFIIKLKPLNQPRKPSMHFYPHYFPFSSYFPPSNTDSNNPMSLTELIISNCFLHTGNISYLTHQHKSNTELLREQEHK